MNPLKRIVVDARMVGVNEHGISRYVCQMAEGLAEISARPYELCFLVDMGYRSPFSDLGFQTEEVRTRFLDPRELYHLPPIIRRLNADLYHSPSFSSLLNCPCPWIVTIHDLCHQIYGNFFQRQYYQRVLKPFALKARKILTVSQFSKGEIALWLRKPLQEIDVVANAMDRSLIIEKPQNQIKDVLGEFDLKARKYFLSVSSQKSHKNIEVLLEAYRRYRTDVERPWPLAIRLGTGGVMSGVRTLRKLSASELEILMSQAGAFLFPSEYEGFGRPPVEAAIAGAPIICSRIAPLEECLQDLESENVHYVEPRDRAEWTRAMKIAHEGDIEPPTVGTRQKILDTFSVTRLGNDMDRIYRSVLGQKPG